MRAGIVGFLFLRLLVINHSFLGVCIVFLLNPLFIILAIVWGLTLHDKIYSVAKTLFLAGMIIVLGYLTIVWPIYGLHTLNYPAEKQKTETIYHLNSYGNRSIADKVIWTSDKPYIRSLTHYGLGVLMVTQRSIGGNTTYFLGEIEKNAWKKYFPVVYFIKEPLAFWGLVVIVLLNLAVIFKPNKYKLKHWMANYFVEFSMLTWLAIYWYASITANLNIGVRHLMPTYGFVFILLAGQLVNLGNRLKTINHKKYVAFGSAVGILLGWYLFENLKVFPSYLTYFNQVAGGPKNGYLYVVDSNVDWGQDAKRLTDWVNANKITKISLDYFGWADAGYYLGNKYIWINAGKYKNAREFITDNPDGGYIAVSKSFFMGSRGNPETSYAWLDSYTPIADIGNSIFVWRINP